MDFTGHQLYKVGGDYIFDLTDCIGYIALFNEYNEIIDYNRVFRIIISGDKYSVEYEKDTVIPFGIVRKACNIVKRRRETLYGKSATSSDREGKIQ